MAKDYFQDIVPPDPSKRSMHSVNHAKRERPQAHHEAPSHTHHEEEARDESDQTEESESDEVSIPIRAVQESASERSIRNISVERSRVRPEPGAPIPPRRSARGPRTFLWGVAGVCVIALAILGFVALRSTVVTVTPRMQPVTLDASQQYTAYPVASAASGTLAYSVRTVDLEDSQVVPTTGTVHAEDKASGTITVYNAYQTSPLKLIKNTRFESADGHIFRAPADIVIPGKNGSTPGQVSITVIADQAGADYNVAAGKFTVPGLKSTAQMYANVYAESSQPMTGGFVGDKPGVDDATLQSAISEVRGRLESKAHESASDESEGTVTLPDLIQIAYTDEPQTTEAGGGTRIHETAHVQIPVFPAAPFVQAVGNTDPTGSTISFKPGDDFAAHMVNASSTLGTDPLTFTVSGSGQLIWGVDEAALTAALAGKPQSSFESIVSQFAGVEEAHARIEPFWKSAFPVDPKAIKVSVTAPSSR